MSAIFEELGIDYEIMMTDPKTFWCQVETGAEKLKTILKADTNIDNYVKNQIATENFNFDKATTYIQDMYEYADESVPVGALKTLADKFRKLARDLEFLARDKAMLELADSESMDKKTAHEMYRDLQTVTNKIIDAWTILKIPHDAEKLPSMPGNYGGQQVLTRYVFVFKGENADGIPYRDFSSVVHKLTKAGHQLPEMKNVMDLIDYLNDHPELGVTVSQQSEARK